MSSTICSVFTDGREATQARVKTSSFITNLYNGQFCIPTFPSHRQQATPSIPDRSILSKHQLPQKPSIAMSQATSTQPTWISNPQNGESFLYQGQYLRVNDFIQTFPQRLLNAAERILRRNLLFTTPAALNNVALILLADNVPSVANGDSFLTLPQNRLLLSYANIAVNKWSQPGAEAQLTTRASGFPPDTRRARDYQSCC